MPFFRNVAFALPDLFLAECCTNCSTKLLDFEKYLCFQCQSDFKKQQLPFHDIDNPMVLSLFGDVKILFSYKKNSPTQKLLHQFKYQNTPKIASFFIDSAKDSIRNFLEKHQIDLLIPVPIHPKKLRKRGFNQAELLCESIISHFPTEIDPKNLFRKVHSNKSQAKKNFQKRVTSDNPFEAKHPFAPKYKNILLIDDVFTTGTTAVHCSKAIKKYTPANIFLLTILKADSL